MKLREVTPAVRIGPAIDRRNLTIFPLFAEDAVSPAAYVPIGPAIRSGFARITEVSEGGSVPTLRLDNTADIPVLIIDGEELLGARQNRISNLTVLAPGKQAIELPVSCVERGRWSYSSHEFAESPDIIYRAARANKSRAVSQNMKTQGKRSSDQGSVWSDIDQMSSQLGFNSPTGAMRDVSESRGTMIGEYLRDVDVIDGQVGVVFAINGAAAGLELFDSTETLRTYLPKILRSYALDAIANQTLAPVTTEAEEASRLLESILEIHAESFPALGLGEDLRLDSTEITGGALAHNGRVIHLAAFNTAPPKIRNGNGSDADDQRPLVVRQGHMMIRGGHGRLALLDTGSPVSIGRGAEYRVAGQVWNPATTMRAVLDAASSHIGRRVEWLFGQDFFAANRVLVDWPRRNVRLVNSHEPDRPGIAIPFELVMGVPVVTGRASHGAVRAVVDSGASISYVPSALVEDLAPIGRRKDFYPGFGAFETDVWRVRAVLGPRRITLQAGVLPPMLQMMFAMLLGPDGWIVGSDFFRGRVIEIDYARQRFVDLTRAEDVIV